MSTITVTHVHYRVTMPANTDEHEIDFDAVLPGVLGEVIVKRISGTSVQISPNGTAISGACGVLDATDDRLILPIKRGVKMKAKGGAGSEVFSLTVNPLPGTNW